MIRYQDTAFREHAQCPHLQTKRARDRRQSWCSHIARSRRFDGRLKISSAQAYTSTPPSFTIPNTDRIMPNSLFASRTQ